MGPYNRILNSVKIMWWKEDISLNIFIDMGRYLQCVLK